MKTADSQAGLDGFGSAGPAVPVRGPLHAKHRGRKNKNHGKGGHTKLRRKRA